MEKVHRLSLQKVYFDAVVSGSKTKEGRCNTGKAANIGLGDRIAFSPNEDDSTIFLATVTRAVNYPSFAEMLAAEGIENMLPGLEIKALEDAVELYRSFPSYRERELEFGVRCLEFVAHQ